MRRALIIVVAGTVAVLAGSCSRKAGVSPAAEANAPSIAVVANSGGFIMEAQQSGTTASLRGLSVVSDRVVWASGANGTVLRTLDSGASWQTIPVSNATTLDLRDIHAFNETSAVAMATAGRLFRTADGGTHWTQVYASSDTSVFLDAISFWDASHGIVIGDPIAGAFLILLTDDGGVTWRELERSGSPVALPGEAAFAASGTALAVAGRQHVWFGTGGATQARVFRSEDRGRRWSAASTDIVAGNASSGIFSVAFSDTLNGVIAGGDYRQPSAVNSNLAVTRDGGRTFIASRARPLQYLSALAWHSPPLTLLGAGTAGVVYSAPGASGWTTLDAGEWNALGEGTRYTWVAGPTGRIARIKR